MQAVFIRRPAARLAPAWVLAATLCAAGAVHAQALPAYQVTRLHGLESASDINNHGQVVGTGVVNGIYQGVSWQAGTTTTLPGQGGLTGASHPLALNNSGVIVGTTTSGAPLFDGLIYGEALRWHAAGAVPITLATADTMEHSRTGYGINDAGQVAGSSIWYGPVGPFGSGYRNVEQATVWSASGQATVLRYDGFPFGSGANAINRDGWVVGWVTQDDVGYRAAVWSSTTADARLLSSPGLANSWGTWDSATSVNDNGLIVGYTTDEQERTHAQIWFDDFRFELAALPGDNTSMAVDINNLGQAIGVSYGDDDVMAHAVLWGAGYGPVTDLDSFMGTALRDAGWNFHQAVAINDLGNIVVNGYNPQTGDYGAFLLTAVPEPGSLAMYLSGLLMLLGSRRRVAWRASQEPAA